MNTSVPPPHTDPKELADERQALLDHPLQRRLTHPRAWRVFMAHHVFAVWDFMSLLKRLQRDLTCTSLPWRPPPDTAACRLVNAIVLAEESDEDGAGGSASHFELYVAAMGEMGADTGPVRAFTADLGAGLAPADALRRARAPAAVVPFVTGTLDVALDGRTEEVAGAFLWGREDVLPDMFAQLLAPPGGVGPPADRLRAYLARHVQLDGEDHGPGARALVERLTPDAGARRRAQAAGLAALCRRRALWTAIAEAIEGVGPTASPGAQGA